MDLHDLSREELLYELNSLHRRIAELETVQPPEYHPQCLMPGLRHNQLFHAQAALPMSDGYFATIFNSIPIAITLTSFPDPYFISVNNSFTNMFGYSRDDVMGRTSHDIRFWERQEYREAFFRQLALHRQLHNIEVNFRTRNGIIKTGLISAELIEMNGQTYMVSGIVDITDRKQAEESLQQSRANLRRRNQEFEALSELHQQVVDFMPDLVFRLDAAGSIRYYHCPTARLQGLAPAIVVGQNIANLLPEQTTRLLMGSLLTALATEKPQEIEYEMTRGDQDYHFEARVVPTSENEVLIVIRDVSDTVKLKHELARLAQLNLVGELAASIGHEVRNPMTTVRGFLQLLSGKDECQPYRDYFDLMVDELDRANTIISEFLSLARGKTAPLEEQNLNEIVTVLTPLIQSDAIMQNKFLHLDLDPALPDMSMHSQEIRQLILNLARNGLEAMTPQGTLTLGTKLEGEEIVLSIRDQGCGIPSSMIEKLGTPFFTTKDKGTGLGLAVCYNIAAKHKARLKVDTSPKGTTFYIRFNLAAAGR